MALTKSEMLNQLAEKAGLKKKEIVAVLDAYTDLVVRILKKDKKMKLPGLGIAQVKHRAARMGCGLSRAARRRFIGIARGFK